MLFVDGAHLSCPYKGTLLTTIVLDVDDHLFNVAKLWCPPRARTNGFGFGLC